MRQSSSNSSARGNPFFDGEDDPVLTNSTRKAQANEARSSTVIEFVWGRLAN